jgi:hypothetical protein
MVEGTGEIQTDGGVVHLSMKKSIVLNLSLFAAESQRSRYGKKSEKDESDLDCPLSPEVMDSNTGETMDSKSESPQKETRTNPERGKEGKAGGKEGRGYGPWREERG